MTPLGSRSTAPIPTPSSPYPRREDTVDLIHPVVNAYLASHCAPQDNVLSELEAETRASAPNLQSSHYEGELLTMLTRLTGARKALSLGVFTGYSTLCMARGMPADGHIIGCEVNGAWGATAQKYWQKAGVADRIDLRIAPALETLRALPDESAFDLAYIGADKANYPAYYEEILRRLRSGGVIILGDVLRSARLFDESSQDAEALVVRKLNDVISHDDRVDSVMFAAGHGATIVRKR